MEITERMLDGLEDIRKEGLEKDIVCGIASRFGVSASEAMGIYFGSRLSRQIEMGEYGMQYLDAEYLLDDLVQNEPELFVGL